MKCSGHRLCVIFALSYAAVGAQDSGSRKADVSQAPATKMETYNVDEAVSQKTHTLFMGADIELNLDRDLYRVYDVVGSNWVVRVAGRDHVVSAKSAPEHLKITPTLKVTEASVTITGFVKAQAYSFANDPNVLLTRGLNQSAVMGADLQSASDDAQARADTSRNNALGGAAVLASSDDQFSANAELTSAQYAFSNLNTTGTHLVPVGNGFAPLPNASTVLPVSTSTGGSSIAPGYSEATALINGAPYMMNNPTSDVNRSLAVVAARQSANQTRNGNEATGKIATGGLDAMDIQFGVRSAKLLQNPYVVTMTRFRTESSKPGVVQNLVYAKSLDPIDEHVQRVHLVEEGFPFGFEVVDFQLHIYNRGVEIASNVAADRVELTRDEAFEYVKLEYIGSHQKDTLPPMAAMGRLPRELPSRLSEGKYSETYYVKVSRDGFAEEAYRDHSCTKEVGDIFLNSAIKSLRFKPALEQGKAVDGIAEVNLSKLGF
jgi:hypothetical protein